MFDQVREAYHFFAAAFWAGTLSAVVCAYLGVWVVLKRVVFIGIALSEVAAAGVAMGFLTGLSPLGSGAVLTLAAVTIVAAAGGVQRIPQEAILGILFVLAGAGSVMMVAHSGLGLEQVKDLLWGNILVAGWHDVQLLLLVIAPIFLLHLLAAPRLVLVFVDRDLAQVFRAPVRGMELFFFYTLGLAVAVFSKINGSLLTFAYLVIPGSLALLVCRRMHYAFLLATVMAVVATWAGLYGSYVTDSPASQFIILALGGCFVLGLAGRLLYRLARSWFSGSARQRRLS